MIKGVILDFDDTLCMTELVCYRLENEVLREMSRPFMSREVHKRTWGRPLFEAILERSPGIDLEEFKKAYTPILANFVETGKLDEIPYANLQTLDSLIADGRYVVILTGRTKEEVYHLLTPKHPLNGRLEAFYHRGNMEHHKPDPLAFSHIEKKHGWRPEECVYVGDTRSDAISAKGAGLHFIASLESGLLTPDDFADLNVDYFLDSFPNLPDTINLLD